VAYSADLARDAAAAHLDQHIEACGVAGQFQRAYQLLLEQDTRAEILSDLLAIDDEFAAAGKKTHPRHRGLATTRALIVAFVCH
jgi:hypothetical protein